MAETWGIALGGGGVPGVAAHLGFLSVLEANGLMPPVAVGTSAGGLVIGGLAAGAALAEWGAFWRKVAADSWMIWADEAAHALDVVRKRAAPGMFSLWSVLWRFSAPTHRFLESKTSEWRTGYGVTASDLTAGKPVLIASDYGPQISTDGALMATSAFPGIFTGIRTPDGHLLCDGGLYDMVPVDACRALGASRVVAVRIGVSVEVPPVLSAERLLQIVVSRGLAATDAATNSVPADLKIEVPTRGGLLSLDEFDADFAAGVTAGTDALSQIRKLAVLAAGG